MQLFFFLHFLYILYDFNRNFNFTDDVMEEYESKQ